MVKYLMAISFLPLKSFRFFRDYQQRDRAVQVTNSQAGPNFKLSTLNFLPLRISSGYKIG